MATNITGGNGRARNPWRPAVWGTAAGLLLLPLVAMQFTREVQWDGTDFAVMGAMLLAACGAYELAVRLSRDSGYRLAFAIAIVAGFLTVWVNLAVGMIGSEDNAFNLLFGGVLAVGALGALLARFRAGGMARAMLATGVAQAAVVAVALVGGWDLRGAVFSAFFVAPWLVSALLFRRVARQG